MKNIRIFCQISENQGQLLKISLIFQIVQLLEKNKNHIPNSISSQCTDVRFASFFSGGFITAIVVNPPERKLAKRTSVQWVQDELSTF